jgi:branched-chain amino acid transport system substrate-binding protein
MGRGADGLIMVGGASPPERRSARMNEFIRRFTLANGSWNDEAGTNAYALEFVLGTLQTAGHSAINDIARFKAAIPHFAMDDPLANGRASLSYYGSQEFRQKRQIGIPLVVNEIRGAHCGLSLSRGPKNCWCEFSGLTHAQIRRLSPG